MSKRLFHAAGCAVLLAGCQGMPADSPAGLGDDPMRGAPPITRGFDAAGLSQVLLAEMAGQRGDFRRAAVGYRDAAKRYRSPALAERATLAARYTEDSQLLSATAALWRQLAPDDEGPEALLSGIAVDRGDWPQALEHRLALARQGGDGELLALIDLALGSNAALEPLREPLDTFVTAHPDDVDAGLAMARLEAVSGSPSRAQRRLARLAEIAPDNADLWLLRSQIALESGDTGLADTAARRGLEAAPDDSRFLLALTQSAIAQGDIPAAERQIDQLLARHGENPTLRIALARLYLQADATAPAQRLLLPLLERDDTPSGTYLLLGDIASARGETDNALLYYRQVPPGPGFLESRALGVQSLLAAKRYRALADFVRIEALRHTEQRSTLIRLGVEALDSADRTAEADALLAEALERAPSDNDLLYNSAMRDFNQGDVDTMMATLRRLIERDPDNAAALNALGYTLATHEQRYEEALGLVERADALQPDSPAILDSLGWIHFKLGDPGKALGYLGRAYEAAPDQEIAAHYAEVLHALDQTTQAQAVVQAALANSETAPDIDALLLRYPMLAPSRSSSPSSSPNATGSPDANLPAAQ